MKYDKLTSVLGVIAGSGISIDALIQHGIAGGWKQLLGGLAIGLLGIFTNKGHK